ncbi:hypothetical protein FA15DRAFT_666968 [Coprinopsis marcescibilis]|uniref:Uncharacterized protein n=1 Tax=Coprinopsis marcescibilis TaxID=230819 RepID=A0A5C3LEE3_COPMA|nr:hypothetical protein FA15DRAFT_666968 [Coprinopsis marcescibilis]
MPGFKIRNQSKYPKLRAFVSNYSISSGSAEWFSVPPNFDDPEKCLWARPGWEVVVFEDPASGLRRGWYLSPDNGILELYFFTFEQELGIVKTK